MALFGLRSVRRTWRRLMRDHQDLVKVILIGAFFVVAGLAAAKYVLP